MDTFPCKCETGLHLLQQRRWCKFILIGRLVVGMNLRCSHQIKKNGFSALHVKFSHYSAMPCPQSLPCPQSQPNPPGQLLLFMNVNMNVKALGCA